MSKCTRPGHTHLVPFRVLIGNRKEDFLQMILVVVKDVGPQEPFLSLPGDALVEGLGTLLVEPVIACNSNNGIIGPGKVGVLIEQRKTDQSFQENNCNLDPWLFAM